MARTTIDSRTPAHRSSWSRGLAVRMGAAAACLTGAAAAQLALSESVPSDAFMFYRWEATPEAAFITDHYGRVFDAIVEADFGGMIVDEIAPTVASGDDLQQVRDIHQLVDHLVGSVPWRGLGEHEVVLGLRQHSPDVKGVMGAGSDFQVLAGTRVDQDTLGAAYASLTRIFATAEQLAPDKISLTVVIDDGEAQRELGGVETLVEAQDHLGSQSAVMCHLSALMDDGWSGYGWKNVGSLMFVEDKVFLTAARGADTLAEDALASMRGRGDCLIHEQRLADAFEGLPPGYEEVYFDTSVMIEPMRQTLHMAAKGGNFGSDAMARDPEIAAWSEVFSLLDCWGAMAGRTYVEDGRQVNESVVRFRDDPAARRNPFYLSHTSDKVGDTLDLLNFVPADATGFTVYEGFDLVPFYDWAMERVGTYVPDADMILPMYGAAQGALGIDVRDELLAIAGAPSVSVTVPRQRRGQGGPETVVLSRPAKLDASRDLEQRFVTIAENLLPMALEKYGPELRRNGVKLDARIGPNDGAFRTLHKLEVAVGFGPFAQTQSFLFGHVGPVQVASTSEEAIAYVLETYAGEYPSVTEEGPLVDLDALPEGPVSMVTMTDIGGSLQEAAAGMVQAGAMMPAFVTRTGNPEADRASKAMMASMGGTFRRMGQIYASLDFLGRSVTSTRASEDGSAVFSKTVVEFRDDD